MKLRNSGHLLSIGALTAITLTAMPARAALVADPVNNDIFLGIRASGGLGSSTSYLVNLGQYSQFRDASPDSTTTLNLGNLGTDLVATFGSNWNTRPDVFWGVFGVSNSINPTVFSSRDRSVSTSSWPALDSTARGTTASAIVSVLQGVNGYQGRDATANSAVAAFQPNFDSASSYNKQVATAGTNDFGSLSQWSSIEGDFGDGTAGTGLDLYRFGSTGVTNPGYFTISDSAVISFTSVPEPTTPMLALAGGIAWVTSRRRRYHSL